MEQYNWLIKKKQKAVSVFHSAKRELDLVVQKINNEIHASHARLADHREAIATEESAIKFLETQANLSIAQSNRIGAILET